jgi:hypothetical protein
MATDCDTELWRTNRVVTKYSAIVDGKLTALAGCDGESKGCAQVCLRKSPELAKIQRMNYIPAPCHYRIMLGDPQ